MNCCLSCCLPLLMSTNIGRTSCHVHLCSLSQSEHIHTCKSEVGEKWLGFAGSIRWIIEAMIAVGTSEQHTESSGD